ncbi:hypothetical protein RSAG8_12229, partial [Rhizoctonia solani AG-8 WAC10335]
MKFALVALTLALFAAPAQAAWCCCEINPSSRKCCRQVMGADTFYSPKCGLISGQTCDVGSDWRKQEDYVNCCKRTRGGICF